VHNGKIIGEGYHQKYGEPHAEVNAVNSVSDASLLSESTIYVSLEPCAHFGKTPPCADLLVKHQFKRVVIGCEDTFSQVSGRGIKRLQDAGIQVELGILEKECRLLNRHFFTFHENKRPYVLLKWAETKNGLIDNSEGENEQVSWISCPETKALVHQWRSHHAGILVGKNTVMADNPSLTVREVKGSNPIRIVLDGQLSLHDSYSVKNDEASTLILNTKKSEIIGSNEYIKLTELTPKQILSVLFEKGIQSVLIEGGKKTLESFIKDNLWDEARVIQGSTTFDTGTSAPKIHQESDKIESFFSDRIHYFWNT
ncbi:MAG: bifunctional diaminohydroxyphosphoribosylaminopyrimidine deaminase/5-amino-6-(5-phosphoribosylamino)uracil reductase RibD, partial [Crocinitomicaceae bacterium]|nr:bifunctional diaminohydroxyphosphoribosylaminopyrimidine deaminase/5-amino-6-(5-phosphoribosylamino)uracil reductase RibD [Crocinitomicaceae bacterium]